MAASFRARAWHGVAIRLLACLLTLLHVAPASAQTWASTTTFTGVSQPGSPITATTSIVAPEPVDHAVVYIEVDDAAYRPVDSRTFVGALGVVPQQVEFAFVPPMAGAYHTKVIVATPDWSTELYRNEIGGMIHVTDPSSTVLSGVPAAPAAQWTIESRFIGPAVAGSPVTTSTTVAAPAPLGQARVYVEILDASYTMVGSASFVDMVGTTPSTYQVLFTPPAAGTYHVKAIVLTPDWSQELHRVDMAGSHVVTAAAAPGSPDVPTPPAPPGSPVPGAPPGSPVPGAPPGTSDRAAVVVRAVDAGSERITGPYLQDQGYHDNTMLPPGQQIAPVTSLAVSTQDPVDMTRLGATTTPMEVYQTERSADRFTYRLWSLEPGTDYTVRLHFADIGSTDAGQRVFDVLCNGSPCISGLDVFKSAGGARIAMVRDVTVKADADGEIGLEFVATQGTAFVSGIEAIGPAQPAAKVTPITGGFYADGATIRGPDGQPFFAVGANLGLIGFLNVLGTAEGHSTDAQAWGWNMVRLPVRPTTHDPEGLVAKNGAEVLHDHLDRTIKEYTDKKIVVMIDAQEETYLSPDPEKLWVELEAFWTREAKLYRNNPYVWFNVVNEPWYINEKWVRINRRLVKAIRDTGNTNVVVVDGQVWGQDLGSKSGYEGATFTYESSMVPALNARFGNVVLGQHNYGGYFQYTTPAAYSAYLDRAAAHGVAVISAEFGYTTDGSSMAGGYAPNRAGADAVFAVNPTRRVGMLWWNGTAADFYSLKADNSVFYSSAPLSEAGARLWALGVGH